MENILKYLTDLMLIRNIEYGKHETDLHRLHHLASVSTTCPFYFE